MTERWELAPSLADIEALARGALATIPAEFGRWLRSVPIRVEEFADDETLADLGIADPFELMGLYRGVTMSGRDGGTASADIDMIFLYRRPILDYWCDGASSLGHVVRHVLIHEVGHHFGLSDADMEQIEGGL